MLYSLFIVILGLHAFKASGSNSGVFPDAFPFKDGFLGGDAIYSVHIGAERYVWLYGDTFWNNIPKNMSRTFTPEEFPENVGLAVSEMFAVWLDRYLFQVDRDADEVSMLALEDWGIRRSPVVPGCHLRPRRRTSRQRRCVPWPGACRWFRRSSLLWSSG